MVGTVTFCIVEWDAYSLEQKRKANFTLNSGDPSISERYEPKLQSTLAIESNGKENSEEGKDSDSSAY